MRLLAGLILLMSLSINAQAADCPKLLNHQFTT
jgi:hypothetical protein